MFPALERKADQHMRGEGPTFSMGGYGQHEVMVETPEHAVHPAVMSLGQMTRVLKAYRARYREISEKCDGIKYIQIFKNFGEFAGSSMEHSHSQIIASPMIPSAVEREMEMSESYYRDGGALLLHDVLETERADGRRIIHEGERFTTLFPFASHFPYEMHILQEENAQLGEEDDDGIRELAIVIGSTLRTLYELLDNPPYNIFVHSAPCDGGLHEYFRWHVHIIPRLIGVGGFEIGTGMGINPASPEETAREFRKAFREIS